MAANVKKTGKGKPCVYLCARSALSPLLMHVVRMLSRYVTIRSGIDDPESAYLAINECDVFICLLDTETCRQLFALYELGVAVVFQTPIIMIREMKLTTFSQLRVPPHFYKTEILVRPSGRSTGRRIIGRAVNSRSLGEVLVYGFKKSVIFSPESLSKSVDELLGRIISFGRFRRGDMMLRDLGSCCTTKARKKSLVKISRTGVRNNQPKLLLLEAKKPVGCSSQTPYFDGLIPEVSLIPLCTQTNYVANFNADENEESARSLLVKFPRKLNELMPKRKNSEEETEQTYDFLRLDVEAPISSNLNTPLPSPIPPHDSYYPTALPVNPMDISFPPFQIEDLDFNKCALAIAKSDRLPSIIRRRIMRKGL